MQRIEPGRRVRPDLDIWVVPDFAQSVLGFDPAELQTQLEENYPAVGKGERRPTGGVKAWGNGVSYVEADALVPEGWAQVQAMHTSNPFNFVLSDGLHVPLALRTETTYLLSRKLLLTCRGKFGL